MNHPELAERSHVHLQAVARGSAGTLLGAVVSTVAGFALVLVVTRSVSTETAGRFFTASAVFLIALAVSGLGTDTGLARFVLRTGSRGAVRALVRTAAVPVVVVALAIAAVVAVVSPDARWLVWALPLAALSDLALAVIRAHALFRATVLIDRVARPGVQLLLVTLAVATASSGAAIAAAWAAGYAASALLSLRALRRVLARPPVPLDGAGDDVAPRVFWRFTWPRAAARVAQIAIQKSDIVIVAWLLSPADAALYAVATRFVVFGQLANQAVSTVVQPRFTMILAGSGESGASDESGGDRALLDRVFAVTTGWSILSAWPIYLCVAAAPAGYLGWFGDGYDSTGSRAVAVVMCCGMLVAVASGPVDTLLLMTGRSGRSLANTLVALAIDVGLCLVLVPRVGIAGAAVAWVVAVVVRCILATVQLRADIGLALPVRTLLGAAALPVGCVLLPLAALQLAFGLAPVTWLVASGLVGAGYLAVAWRLRAPLAIDLFVAGLRGHGKQAVTT